MRDNPTHLVDIGATRARKHAACFANVSQKMEEAYANDHGRMEIFRGMEAQRESAEAFVLHPRSPEAPRRPGRPA